MKSTHLLLMLLLLTSGRAAQNVPNQGSLESLSFQEQLLLSNGLYIADNIRVRLKTLNNCEDQIRTHTPSPFSEWLDFGEGKELPIRNEIEMLLLFQKQHNGRMDKWISLSRAPSGSAFYEPFKMEPGIVKKIKEKEFPNPWRFVAVHWYPQGLLMNMADHPIPHDGLGLQEGLWLDRDTSIRVYAFFSFYRKNGQLIPASAVLQDFLKRHTGYHRTDSQWARAIETCEDLRFERWQLKDYYSYQVVTHAPTFADGSLPDFIVSQVSLSRQAVKAFDISYRAKCDLFGILVKEMLVCAAKGTSLEPHWELYAYVAQSFPQISAFRLTQAPDGSWCFMEGYEGDRPSRTQFSERSIVGVANALYRGLGEGPVIARRVFEPILLLQARFDPKLDATLKEADVRVGFRGYLDFYRDVLTSSGTEE